MNRNHLALFHAVVKAGGISRGAEQLRISQPAVSKQLKELENSIGVRLFERLPRGIQLTDPGKMLAEYVNRMAILEMETSGALEEFSHLKRGRLVIGASRTIGSYLLPPILGAFHRMYPELDIQLEIANSQVIQQYLSEGQVEIGLTEGLVETGEFDSKPFYEDVLVTIAPPGHPLLKKRGVTAKELCREPFILREIGSGTRAVIEKAWAKQKLTVKPFLSLAGSEAIKSAVTAGLGLAIISSLSIQCELKAGSLAVIPVKDLSIIRPFHIQRLRGKYQSPSATQFLNLLQKRLAR